MKSYPLLKDLELSTVLNLCKKNLGKKMLFSFFVGALFLINESRHGFSNQILKTSFNTTRNEESIPTEEFLSGYEDLFKHYDFLINKNLTRVFDDLILKEISSEGSDVFFTFLLKKTATSTIEYELVVQEINQLIDAYNTQLNSSEGHDPLSDLATQGIRFAKFSEKYIKACGGASKSARVESFFSKFSEKENLLINCAAELLNRKEISEEDFKEIVTKVRNSFFVRNLIEKKLDSNPDMIAKRFLYLPHFEASQLKKIERLVDFSSFYRACFRSAIIVLFAFATLNCFHVVVYSFRQRKI